MSRPADWEPLAGSDPVPGDVYEVTQLSGQLRQIAQTISEQADKLKKLTTSEYWDSEASRKFDGTSQKAASDLDKVYRRYEAAYEAVNGYISPLETEQAGTLSLLQQAQALESAHRQAQARLTQDAAQKWTKPDGTVIPFPPQHLDDESAVAGYGAQLSALQAQMNEAVGRIQSAAQQAANRVSSAADHDGLKDSFWDKVGHVASEIGHAIITVLKVASDILSKISSIVGVLALILCWVPGLGEFLAGLSLVLAAVSLVVDTVLFATGNGSWGKVLMDGIMIVAGGVAKGLQGGFKAALATGKLAKAADGVLPAITGRGGVVTDDVVNALRAGDVATAGTSSGLGSTKVAQLLGAQLGKITREQDVLAGGRKVLVDASRSSFKASDFNPFVNIGHDVAGLRDSLNVGEQFGAFSRFLDKGGLNAYKAVANASFTFTTGTKTILSTVVNPGLAIHDWASAWSDKKLPVERTIESWGAPHE